MLLLAAAVASGAYLLRLLARPAGQRRRTVPPTDFSSFLKAGAVASPADSLRKRSPTGFAAFLKSSTAGDRRDATSFGAFLKSGSNSQADKPGAAPLAAAPSADSKAQPVQPSGDQVAVTVLYGTEYGFSREIAEKLATRLQLTERYWPRVLDMADHPEGLSLAGEQALFVICSTQVS